MKLKNRKVSYKYLIFGALALTASSAFAVTAPEGYVEALQPDGSTLLIRQVGDAFNHVTYSVDGYPLTCDEEGFYVYADIDKDGNICSTGVRAYDPEMRSVQDQEYIGKLDKKEIEKAFFLESQSAKAGISTLSVGLTSTRFPSTGDGKSVVILVEFSDNEFTIENPKEFYTEMLNGEDFTYNSATGSVRKYFSDNSCGAFTPGFDVYGPVKLQLPMKYYGGDTASTTDDKAFMMVIHACEKLDNEIDFSQYDYNDDGYIDNVYVYYAGYGQHDGGGNNAIWPHSWDIEYGTPLNFSYDGKRLNHYACSNELRKSDNLADGIGPFCHEFSHVMGLPDLYQTDYSKGTAYTPESWSLIGAGSYNNKSRTPAGYSAYERYALEWMTPETFTTPGEYTLEPISSSNKAYIVPTENENEFFLIENRQREGWDAYIPGHGMLVWHIDFDQYTWDYNEVNCDPRHQRVDIVEADPTSNTHSKDSFPGRSNVTSFTATTNPAFVSWNKKPTGVEFTNIREEGENLVFTVSLPGQAGIEGIESELGDTVFKVYKIEGLYIGDFERKDLSNLPSGLYILKSPSGKTSKIVI